jgi:hypothetical protein
MSAADPSPIQKPSNVLWPRWRLSADISIVDDHELESSSDSCEKWMWYSGGWVVFGLAVEIFIAIYHYLYYGCNNDLLEIILTISSDTIVTMGVAGEVLFSRLGHRRQEELQKRLKARLKDATDKASYAEMSAATANERAEILKAETSWRSIPNEKTELIKLSLGRSGQPASIWFVVLANDPESFNFAQQLSIAFRDSGWNVGFKFQSYSEGVFLGVMLTHRENWLDEVKIVNVRVRKALIDSDIEFVNGWPSGDYFTHTTPSALPVPIALMYIGPKPMPRL